MSYFVPNTTNNDMNELSKENGDFDDNSVGSPGVHCFDRYFWCL